ncbi:hypothetical protein PG999_014211 [Apiospora kogelbergensis]|uniref:Transcription factor domain-containing protein n=1 Tax=Apiospora kogelbergensis TaxID=1337665 RepID=A0AAW0Q6R5_9PEZI
MGSTNSGQGYPGADRPVGVVKFVDSDPSGLPLKRKQVAQACVACRRRKKRCTHEPQSEDPKTATPRQQQHAATASPPVLPRAATTAATAAIARSSSGRSSLPSPPDLERRPSRFVGDLNPEHFLIEATSPHSNRDLSVRGGVGVWHAKQSSLHGEGARPTTGFSSSSSSFSSPSVASALRSGPGRTLHDLVVAHVRTHCLSCVPPAPEWSVLKRVYLQRLDPLFPAISSLLQRDAAPADAAAAILVRQVASLAAAADPEARAHLRLGAGAGGPLLGPHEFRAHLTSAVHAALDAGLVTDRMLLVRLLLVLSLYVRPCSPDEADLPALLFTRASHHLQTLGHHIGAVSDDDAAEGQGPGQAAHYVDEVRTVYCCVWALDRLTAAFYGRACILHERDIGWDMDKVGQQLPPAFRLFMAIARLLDRVIDIYRPVKTAGADEELEQEPVMLDLPILETMIIDAGATEVPSGLLATLEVFYHSVAILSCKPSSAEGHGLFPHSAINGRRSHSADRITDIVGGSEFRHPQGSSGSVHQQQQPPPPPALKLSCTPLLPYAVSLALGVAYLKMRHSQVPLFRARGRRAFVAAAALLRDDPRLGAGGTSWTARTMAGMAEQVLQEMDKAAATATASASATADAAVANHDDVGDNGRKDGGDVNEVANENLTATTGPTVLSSAATAAVAPPSAGMLYDDNVFEHLDPSFDLDAVDAAIEGSLDFGASSNWFDWQQHTWSFTAPQQ